MQDCFISYTNADARFAKDVAQFLNSQNVSTFIAELSLSSGAQWSAEIKQALNSSKWVVFLASRAACASAAVQQEVGGAVFGGKKLIPVVWDIEPSSLPAWAGEFQAVDLRGMSSDEILSRMSKLARGLRGEVTGRAIGLALLAGLAIALLGGE